jgi:DNA-binding transcriptional LysR family regulator
MRELPSAQGCAALRLQPCKIALVSEVDLVPERVGQSAADFVEDHCLLILGRPGGVDLDDVHSRLLFVERYREAVRRGHPLAADNTARVLLTLAASWSDRQGFQEHWTTWTTLDP